MRLCCLPLVVLLLPACTQKTDPPQPPIAPSSLAEPAAPPAPLDDASDGEARAAPEAEAAVEDTESEDDEAAAYAAAEEQEEDDEAALQARLEGAFAGCSGSTALVAARTEVDTAVKDRDAFLEVQARGAWSIIQVTESGSGMDAADRSHALAVSPGSCTLGAQVAFEFNGSSAVGNVEIDLGGASAEARAALGAELGIEALDRMNPAHALVGLYLGKSPSQDTTLTTSKLVGPVFVKPTWFAGRPTALASVIVPETATIAAPFVDADEPAPLITAAGEGPKKTASFARVDFYESELGGQNGGVALALYDRAKDRHRWVLETRRHLVASRIDWIGHHAGLVVGETRSDDAGGDFAGTAHIVLVRLRDGAVFTLDVPDVFEHGKFLMHAEEMAAAEDASYACAQKIGAAAGFDDTTEEGVAMLHDAYETCEEKHGIPPRLATTKSALRVRDTPTTWIDIRWAELTKAARPIRF